MDPVRKTPFVIIAAQVVVGLFVFFYILYIGQAIILPVVYAGVLAVLLNPLVNRLTHHRVSRVLAIFIAVIVMLLLIGGLIYFVVDQSMQFGDTLVTLQKKVNVLLQDVSAWAARTFKISRAKVDSWVVDTEKKQLNESAALVGQTLVTVTDMLKLFLLIPVYVFMFLFYKPLLLDFISRLFPRENHEMVSEVLFETKTLIQSYLVGLLLEAAIVAALNATGLLLMGIEYAVLLAIIGALLNIIPYIGGIIAVALPVLITYTSKSPAYVVWVLVLYAVVQFIDNHYIVPKIVASKVRINALMSIIVVFIGGAIWGIGGMFLSIPLTAIVKVIFDRISPLKPWGFLLGDTMPPIGKTIFKTPPRVNKQAVGSKKLG